VVAVSVKKKKKRKKGEETGSDGKTREEGDDVLQIRGEGE